MSETTVPNLLSPGFYPIVISSANTASETFRVVLVGKATTGASTPAIATSQSSVNTTYGADSDLAKMFRKFRATDSIKEVYCLPVTLDEDDVPQMATALAKLADLQVWGFGFGFNDTASVTALNTYITARWGYAQQLFGFAFVAKKADAAGLLTYAGTRNDKFVTVVGINGSADSEPEIAAAYAAAHSITSDDPPLPMQNVVLDVAAPALADQFDLSTRESLLQAGISPIFVNDGGSVVLARGMTTYTTNETGDPDNSWSDNETILTLQASIKRLRSVYTRYLTRRVLIDNDKLVKAGSNRITPNTILGLFRAEYSSLCADGWCVNEEEFMANSRIVVKPGGRVELYLPVVLAQQLRVVVTVTDFSK